MSKLSIIHERDVETTDNYPGSALVRRLAWSKQLSPNDFPLRLVLAELEDGGEIEWDSVHGDEGLYVLDGALDLDGRMCDAGGALIVESRVGASVRAHARTCFVHCSRGLQTPQQYAVYGPPEAEGHSCHVVGPGGWFRSNQGNDVVATWFADATCPTCRIALFHVAHRHGFTGPAHSHSQDEIIYVLDGSVQMGRHEYFAGTALCIPAHVRYKVGYPNGGDFLNYRADVSEHFIPGAPAPTIEGGMARGGVLVGDFR